MKTTKEPKLGSGGRFHNLVTHIMGPEGYGKDRASAIAAMAGHKKLGKSKMANLAEHGKDHKK